MDADVVVVNHHLFLADMVVKESGFGELIPEADVMIFDEAHQLPDIASQYFGQSLSSRQLLDRKRHHHRLPHRIKRHPAVTKVRGSSCPECAGFSPATR